MQLVEDLKGRTELLPLESSNVDELKTLQQALALKDKDISSLEIKVQQLEDEITKGRAISKIDELQNVRTPSSVKHSVSHRSTPSHDVSDFDFVAAFIKNNDGDETVAKSASSDNEASYASQNLDELRSTLQLKDQQVISFIYCPSLM